ncbi:hypothetical protein CDL15_Pgr025360 [Punica granatum]|uniref:Uncharacterized protein n=1 Tax=Punica granatum TaxID=22663 RepID=A0A218W9E6_PUNGR|nr:hypothetical protein CDL15_Pgr025360 [Punica granatum]
METPVAEYLIQGIEESGEIDSGVQFAVEKGVKHLELNCYNSDHKIQHPGFSSSIVLLKSQSGSH